MTKDLKVKNHITILSVITNTKKALKRQRPYVLDAAYKIRGGDDVAMIFSHIYRAVVVSLH